ncbi:hypothetical protein AXF42_Ash008241 [Apostasia shenzhenica]|uniref:Pre-rRNA-processing protein las1 n=1 Tax=Apostasia shenzhenica TaxID=1088818 RepID=A0A2I0A903_9ASPA|nr:hypothetical protein AXF42_Ash008241 [Apostasia shenzhenica]
MDSNTSKGKVSQFSGYKLVPWLNWNQWDDVRKSIFSSSPILIASALQKILAWQSKGCIPVAIDVTARIIEIQQMDPFFRQNGSTVDTLASEEMLAMLYCMSIIRLVNGFVEPAHKKTGRSISDLAGALGIPRTLVDIRHESSHRGLPSLKLVRSASAMALEWLKANYWEPQRVAIPNPRKEIKYWLHELIICLKSSHVSRMQSQKEKLKRAKSTVLIMACSKLSLIYQKLLASKSNGSTKHFSKVTKVSAKLYSSYPVEFASILLELFLSQASDISDDMNAEHIDYSECSVTEPMLGSLHDLKMIIAKLSNKKPRLLLSLLKAVLEMIEEMDSRSCEVDGNRFISSQKQADIQQATHLRSLVPFLVRSLKALKDSGQIGLIERNQVLSAGPTTTLKFSLMNLLYKCLNLLAPGDKHLLKSVLLLADMSGNRLLTEKLKILPLLAFLDQPPLRTDDFFHDESTLLKEEDFLKKEAEKLYLIKSRLANHGSRGTGQIKGNSNTAARRWAVTKSWVPCPIGTLPCSFSSLAVLPDLDAVEDVTSKSFENVSDADKKRTVSDIESDDDDGDHHHHAVKRLKEAPVDQSSCETVNVSAMEGQLMIGGVWMKVTDEEVAAIESDVRIFG